MGAHPRLTNHFPGLEDTPEGCRGLAGDPRKSQHPPVSGCVSNQRCPRVVRR